MGEAAREVSQQRKHKEMMALKVGIKYHGSTEVGEEGKKTNERFSCARNSADVSNRQRREWCASQLVSLNLVSGPCKILIKEADSQVPLQTFESRSLGLWSKNHHFKGG